MFQELRFQVSTALLTILTLAAVISAGINLQQQYRFRLPDDGVTWADGRSGTRALHVSAESSGARAGLRRGDVLLRINGVPIEKAVEVTQILVRIGAWNQADYLVHRQGVDLKAKVIVGEVARDPIIAYQYLIGLAYLFIGLFVYFRRGSAQKARHFYILCLASFIFCTFHYTGKLNNFDKTIYWGNVASGLFAPAIFLHFCLSFPEPRKWIAGKVRPVVLYLPAVFILSLFLGLASGVIRFGVPLIEVRWLLDRIWLPYLAALYVIGGCALGLEHRRTEDPIVRQQLKWLRNGTLAGVLPFALIYVIPYTIGMVPTQSMRMAVLSMPLIPLSLAYAILRYRLMDVDVIFQRGYAYTLATLCVLAGFYGIVFSLGSQVQKYFKDLGNAGLITVMLTAAFLFQPIRNWIQERLDRYFYRDRYDYRRTLEEFARELSSETNLEEMLRKVTDRLLHTLAIKRLAFFVSAEEEAARSGAYSLAFGVNLRDRQGRPIQPEQELDLSFLGEEDARPYLFFERTRYHLDAVSRSWAASVRKTISDLDLTYFLPCKVRGRTIAFLGLSRTEDGDFLSSVDLELLMTLSGYVGIAIENARLYQSLERKVEEYERLKEFSENIVESINVGILAAGLDDRVESWNSQMERLVGITREHAVGRTLPELFPVELLEQVERVRGETGIHHVYKFVLPPDYSVVSGGDNGGNGSGAPNGNGAPHWRLPGRERTLNMAIAPLVSKEQQQIGRLIIFDDVTDRTEMERQLVQADKLSSIGLLAAGVAHEVNTPLAVISTYAQMLAKQVAGDEQKSRLLEKIAKQTFRASEIVNSLLNFSRTSTTEFAALDLNRTIQETLSLLDHQLQKAGIQVKTDLEPSLSLITGNPGKLQQVFLNLFLNARDAMQPGGELEVRTWTGATSVRVEVSDTGLGIAQEHLDRIYDPFFTTKAAKKGTGLGLAVTYGIVQEHGGSIDVESQPGRGSRFYLEFPRVRKAVNA